MLCLKFIASLLQTTYIVGVYVFECCLCFTFSLHFPMHAKVMVCLAIHIILISRLAVYLFKCNVTLTQSAIGLPIDPADCYKESWLVISMAVWLTSSGQNHGYKRELHRKSVAFQSACLCWWSSTPSYNDICRHNDDQVGFHELPIAKAMEIIQHFWYFFNILLRDDRKR